MASSAATNPTLADWKNTLDPSGSVAAVIEILNEENEILDDVTFMEGNLPTGHRSVIRSGIPSPTWRKLYGGVQPTKSTRVQVTDNCGMLENYAEVDKALADLNGNTNAFRLQESRAIIEGFGQTVADTIFYGDEGLYPERFTGLAPRYDSLSAENADNIIDAGGTGSDNASIWLVCWGPDTCHGIIPKGSMAGMQVNDKGQVTIEDADGSGGRMEAYRTHFRWDVGLTLRDWRYVVRIANIDKSALTFNAATGSNLIDLMTQAIELLPTTTKGRPTFYVPRTVRSFLRRQMVAKVASSTLMMDEVAGKKVLSFDSIPVRRCDALAGNEARVT